MGDEDPILEGFPISQLRVVDLKDHLEKRGLDKKGNKKELADRLKEYVLKHESGEEDVPTNGATPVRKSPEKSPSKGSSTASPEKENPVISMYKARQQQMIAEAAAEKRKSLETKQSDDEGDDGEKTTPLKETAKSQEATEENDAPEADVTAAKEEKEVTPEPQEEPSKKGRRSTSRSRKASESGNQSPTRRSSRQRKTAEEVGEPAKKVLELEEEKPEVLPSSPARDESQVESQPESRAETQSEPTNTTEEIVTENTVTAGGTESTQANSPRLIKEEPPARSPSPQKERNARSGSPERDVSKPTEQEPQPIKQEITKAPEIDKNDSKKTTEKRNRSEVQHGEEDLDYGDDYEEVADAPGGAGDGAAHLDKNEVDAEEEHGGDETMEVETSRIWLPESAGIKRVKEPSPCRYPASLYVHIRGLTRPFTQNQLDELISKNGKIRDFWIDKIKSNCIIQMSSLEEARHVRRALHNIVWPETNPKSLSVQFTTKEQFARFANGDTPMTPAASKLETRAAPVSIRRESAETTTPRNITLPGMRNNLMITVATNVRDNERMTVRHVERAREKEKEHEKEKEIQEKSGPAKRRRSETPPFSRSVEMKREKTDERSRDKDRTGTRRSRSRDRTRAGSRDRRNETAELPKPKALEELFKKTTAQPSIYYLPLTEEQAAKRAADKIANEKTRAEERERREKERKEAQAKRQSRSRSGDKRR